MKNQNGTSWQIATPETINRDNGEGRSQDDHEQRDRLSAQVAEVAKRKQWSKADVARHINMPEGTFSQWFSGKYAGRLDAQNKKVADWLEVADDMIEIASRIPVSPSYIETRTAKELAALLEIAQIMPAMVLGTCEAGMGKTFTAERYAQARPHCWIATMTPYTRTVHGTLQTVARAVGASRYSNGDIVSAIGDRIARKGGVPSLLVVDEAQNLIDDGINQLRHFVDVFGCGVALLGNTESYGRFTQWSDGPKYGQLHSRIFKRMCHTRPSRSDLEAFIHAWGIDDSEQVEFLTGVGLKPGAFRQIDMTIKFASLTAAGAKQELSLGHLKAAWKNRDVGGRQ